MFDEGQLIISRIFRVPVFYDCVFPNGNENKAAGLTTSCFQVSEPLRINANLV